MRQLLAFTCATLVFSSCIFTNTADKGAVVARVNEHILYQGDVPTSITVGLTRDDSARVVKSYIEGWVKERVLVQKAEQNLSVDEEDLEDRIQAYRNSLLVFEYERALVQSRLDTGVSAENIAAYHNEHQTAFILQEPAYRFYYIYFPSAQHDAYKVRKALESKDPVKIEELKAYGLGYGATFYFEDESWLTKSSLIQTVGTRIEDAILDSNNPLKVLKDDNAVQYLYILDKKEVGEIAPLSLVENEIRSKIINDRKFKLINKMRNDLFNEALNNKDAEIY